MKKTSMMTLVDFLANYPDMAPIREELVHEMERNNDKAARNRELYATALEIVLQEIEDGVLYTVADMYEYVEEKLPETFTKSKLQYALNNYWKDYFEKTVNNPAGYYLYMKKTA